MDNNVVVPCVTCSSRKWCSAYKRLRRLTMAWDSMMVEQDHPFMSVTDAVIVDEGLKIDIECTQYQEDKDAPR
jgi:hypothetical protein